MVTMNILLLVGVIGSALSLISEINGSSNFDSFDKQENEIVDNLNLKLAITEESQEKLNLNLTPIEEEFELNGQLKMAHTSDTIGLGCKSYGNLAGSDSIMNFDYLFDSKNPQTLKSLHGKSKDREREHKKKPKKPRVNSSSSNESRQIEHNRHRSDGKNTVHQQEVVRANRVPVNDGITVTGPIRRKPLIFPN